MNIFTENEMYIIQDNLSAFISNFGKPRIERGDDGESFYVFTDDSSSWRQYCYNIDYLNGWLFGCVQAACGNPKRDEEYFAMSIEAGSRERYALMNGEMETQTIRGHIEDNLSQMPDDVFDELVKEFELPTDGVKL